MTSCIVVQYLQAKHLKVNLIKYIFGRIWLLKNYPPEDQPLCRKVQIGVTGMGSEGEGGASTPTAACRKVKIQARTSWEVCGFVWGRRYAPSSCENGCFKLWKPLLNWSSHTLSRGINIFQRICNFTCFLQIATCCIAFFVCCVTLSGIDL